MNGPMTEARYQSYLLRCWCDGSQDADGAPLWRLSIAEIGSDVAATFLGGVDELAAYVHEQLADHEPEDGPATGALGPRRGH